MCNFSFVLVTASTLIAWNFVVVTGYIERKDKPSTSQNSECQLAWQNITHSIETAQNLRASCINNQECTGTTCEGDYILPLYEVKFCFGLVVEPCSVPNITVLLFVELFNLPGNETTNLTFTSSEMVLIKGAKFEIPKFGNTQVLIQIEMNKKTDSSFYLSVQLRFRITIGSHHQMFLPMSVVLIPGHLIPVPACDESPSHYVHTNGSCHWDATRLPTTTTTSTTIITPLPSSNHNKTKSETCDPDSMYNCKDGQVCAETGVCECPQHIPDEMHVTSCLSSSYQDPGTSPKDNKNDAVVIGSSVTVVTLIVCVLIVVFVLVYRRYRQRYGQHEVLLNNEDDPVEIPT